MGEIPPSSGQGLSFVVRGTRAGGREKRTNNINKSGGLKHDWNLYLRRIVEAAKKAGLYDQFSQYDLDLSRIHPEFGMSLLSYKLDYANAETDEKRTIINAMANNLRKSYGNYTAGPYGSGYYLEPLSSVSQSETSAGISDLLGGLTNRTAFSYDPEPTPTMRRTESSICAKDAGLSPIRSDRPRRRLAGYLRRPQ
jgi:hypothetical protein